MSHWTTLFTLAIDLARGLHIAPLVEVTTEAVARLIELDAVGHPIASPIHLASGAIVLLEALHSLRHCDAPRASAVAARPTPKPHRRRTPPRRRHRRQPGR